MSETEPWAGLGETVRAIRRELQESLEDGAGKPIQFELGPIDLDFSVEVRKARGGGIGIHIYALSADGKKSVDHAQANRVKLTLNPVDPAGKRVKIASQQGADTAPPLARDLTEGGGQQG